MVARYLFLALMLACLGCGSGGEEKAEDDSPKDQPYKARPAKVGVGRRGRGLEKTTGAGKVVASPAATFFRIKEKLVFEVQLKQAMDLYKATNGRLPRSHAAFMRDIVHANNIVLPELPDNAEYEFRPRPKPGKLWVVPKKPAK